MTKRKQAILIVDDIADEIIIFEASLKEEGYLIRSAPNGPAALQAVAQRPPDLILFDRSGLNYNQFEKKIKHVATAKDIPVITVTDLGHINSKRFGQDDDEDFILKPVDSTELRMRLRSALHRKEQSDLLKQRNQILEKRMRARSFDLHTSYMDTIYALIRAAEHRDDDTGTHLQRISHYSSHLAKVMGMAGDFCEKIHYSSQMHDIGKIGIPDHILLKPAAHSSDEFEIMKTHCLHGAEILYGLESPYLKMGAEIALRHHEHWDGSGYPDFLSGEDIPLSARIMGVCDVYDALRSKRPYKPAFGHDQVMNIIVDGDGRTQPEHFDPDVLDAFKLCHRQFNEIFHEHSVYQAP